MKLPSRDMRLAGGLVCPARAIDRAAWLEHVVKHPLGVNAIARNSGRDPWNLEGWDRLSPPVVTQAQRDEVLRGIASLREEKLRCEVPELRGKKSGSEPDRLACRKCVVPIVSRCEKLLDADDGVGSRYASVTEELLGALEEGQGVVIAPASFHEAIQRLWRAPERLAGLVVLTIGLDRACAAVPIARISRADGVRAELYFEEPNRLRWRTAYRNAALTRTGPQIVSFVGEVARPSPGLALSDLCVVPRRWWEAHGI